MRPAPQQASELEAVESNDDDVGSAVDIRGFNVTIYKHIKIWVRID